MFYTLSYHRLLFKRLILISTGNSKWNIKSFSSFCGFIGWDWRYQLDISGCYILLFDRKRNWCLQGHSLAVNLLYCDIIMQPIWGGCLFPWSNNTFIFIDGSVNCIMGRFNTQGIKSRHHDVVSWWSSITGHILAPYFAYFKYFHSLFHFELLVEMRINLLNIKQWYERVWNTKGIKSRHHEMLSAAGLQSFSITGHILAPRTWSKEFLMIEVDHLTNTLK